MSDLWIFGYGSLMWRPGFAYAEAALAVISGYNRSFCIFSVHHRGSGPRPGLVLGLDRGGTSHGMAYRIEPERTPRDAELFARSRAGDRRLSRNRLSRGPARRHAPARRCDLLRRRTRPSPICWRTGPRHAGRDHSRRARALGPQHRVCRQHRAPIAGFGRARSWFGAPDGSARCLRAEKFFQRLPSRKERRRPRGAPSSRARAMFSCHAPSRGCRTRALAIAGRSTQ